MVTFVNWLSEKFTGQIMKKINIHIPRYKIRYSINYKIILKKLLIRKLFRKNYFLRIYWKLIGLREERINILVDTQDLILFIILSEIYILKTSLKFNILYTWLNVRYLLLFLENVKENRATPIRMTISIAIRVRKWHASHKLTRSPRDPRKNMSHWARDS